MAPKIELSLYKRVSSSLKKVTQSRERNKASTDEDEDQPLDLSGNYFSRMRLLEGVAAVAGPFAILSMILVTWPSQYINIVSAQIFAAISVPIAIVSGVLLGFLMLSVLMLFGYSHNKVFRYLRGKFGRNLFRTYEEAIGSLAATLATAFAMMALVNFPIELQINTYDFSTFLGFFMASGAILSAFKLRRCLLMIQDLSLVSSEVNLKKKHLGIVEGISP